MRVYVPARNGLRNSESCQGNCLQRECEGALKDPECAEELINSVRPHCGAAARCMNCKSVESMNGKGRRCGCGSRRSRTQPVECHRCVNVQLVMAEECEFGGGGRRVLCGGASLATLLSP